MDKIALDKYLTTPPPDNDYYFEGVYNLIPESYYKKYNLVDNEEIIDKVIDVCYWNLSDNVIECVAVVVALLDENLIKGIGNDK